ncbi:MAG: ParA family protein [Hylemonella sp.]
MSALLKILITSQKGGVGKSTVSANLAAYFAHTAGKLTALIDLDHQGTAGKWVRNIAPIGIQCISVASPNNKGAGMALLQARQAMRSANSATEVIIADLTWTDILPAEFMFEFDMVLVPSSLSRVELDSTLEFVNRFDFVFNSKLRHPPKLIVVPSRVVNMDTYKNIFFQSFNTAFFLSPPVRFNDQASEFFGAEFFVKAQDEETRENFIQFGRSIEEIGRLQNDAKPQPKGLYQPKMTSSILDRFRAGRNATAEQIKVAANDFDVSTMKARLKAVIPSFLRSDSAK